jgi:hypothetical protein
MAVSDVECGGPCLAWGIDDQRAAAGNDDGVATRQQWATHETSDDDVVDDVTPCVSLRSQLRLGLYRAGRDFAPVGKAGAKSRVGEGVLAVGETATIHNPSTHDWLCLRSRTRRYLRAESVYHWQQRNIAQGIEKGGRADGHGNGRYDQDGAGHGGSHW